MKNFVFGAMLCAGVGLYAFSASAELYYKYDANGNLIEEDNGSHRHVYTYDTNGNQTSDFLYSGGIPWVKTEYIYDSNGNKEVALGYSCSRGCGDTPNEKHVYTYDTNGNMTSDSYYSNATAIANNTVSYKYEYTNEYENDKLKSQTFYYCSDATCSDAVLGSKYEYEYDTNGNQTLQAYYTCNGNTCSDTPVEAYEYTYNDDGSKRTMTLYNDSVPVRAERYNYDENGNQTSMEYYSGYRYYMDTFTYDFDEYGNILKKYVNGTSFEIYEYEDGQAYANIRLGIPSSCEDGYALIDNACVEIKTRFTMQEAEALTTNDNNNWVEWTFE